MKDREEDEDWIFTSAVRGGETPEKFHGALATPIYRASVYQFDDPISANEIHEGHKPGYFYGRMGTPTQSALESAICELERGEAAIGLASGMSAISSLLLTILKPGDHVLAPRSIYASTSALMKQILAPLGISIDFVNETDPAAWRAAATRQTKLVYAETPTNPMLTLVDLPALVQLAREYELISVVDNTFATPFNQRPIEMGVDFVVHSATKYLGGHADVVAGIAIGHQATIEKIRWHTAKLLGGIIAPDTASLVHRGLKTLPIRMQRHNANALAVARFLEQHSEVIKVHYPGLKSHVQYELALRQMRGFGGLIAFEVANYQRACQMLEKVKLCRLAVSLGDVSTLIQHSASMTHASLSKQHREAAGISDGLIRLSVGIERADDIISDLDQALAC